MNRWSRVGIIVIIMVLALAGAGTHAAATAPAGLSAAEWRNIQAQLPPSRTSGMDQSYLKSPTPGFLDDFGDSIAISGDTLVIGAPGEDNVGGVHIFVRANGTWTYQDYLRIGEIDSRARFGYAVAIDGDTIVIGAPSADRPTVNDYGKGAVYVFVRSNGAWNLQDTIRAVSPEETDEFGYAVAIENDTIVVGTPGDDSDGSDPADNSLLNSGSVYVFARANGAWTQQSFLKAANADPGDVFGISVAISGPTIVVGALGEGSNGSSPANNSVINAGAVYVFARTGGAWAQQAYLKAPIITGYDVFGYAVAIEGDTIVVGSPHDGGPCCQRAGSSPTVPAVLQTGEAFVFGRMSGVVPTWTLQATLRASNADISDGFGVSVAINGDTIVVGASGEDSNGSSPADNTGDESGAIYVFGGNGSVWTELSYRKAFNLGGVHLFGAAVATSDGALFVGAPWESSDGSSPTNKSLTSGAVYVQQVGGRIAMPVVVQR